MFVIDSQPVPNQVLVDIDHLVYADIEDSAVFMIQSVLVRDDDEKLAPVFEFINTHGYELVSERTVDTEMYLHHRAIVRRWELKK